jgi:hypothetical protein
MKSILITGAIGQIGSELRVAQRKTYGADKVIAMGRLPQHSPGPPKPDMASSHTPLTLSPTLLA